LSFDNITEDQQEHIMGSAMVTNSSCSFYGTVTIDNHITFTVFNCTYGQAVDLNGTNYSDDHLEGTWNHGIWRASSANLQREALTCYTVLHSV
jgi:hypothetical protein